MKTQFSLRLLLLATAVIGCILAVFDRSQGMVTAVTFTAQSSAEPVSVYLDNRRLGVAPLSISLADAKRLGIGKIGNASKFESNAFGVFLSDYKRNDGHVPHINFRKQSSRSSTFIEAMRHDEVVLAKMILPAGGTFEFFPRNQADSLRTSIIESVNATGGRARVVLNIPNEIRDTALNAHGGLTVSITAFSVFDGKQRHQSFTLNSLSDLTPNEYAVSLESDRPPGSIVLLICLEGNDGRPIANSNGLYEGVAVSCADGRWAGNEKKKGGE